jgi:hypothetical protein
LAWLRAGNKSAARMAMMAITTNSSIKVKAERARGEKRRGARRLPLSIKLVSADVRRL